MLSLSRAIELVSKLSRTRGYPTDDEGVNLLAKGLQNATEKTQVGAGRIVDTCAAQSAFCPTDYDLLTIAKELARQDAVADGSFDSLSGQGNTAPKQTEAELRRKYGEPAPFDWTAIDKNRVKLVREREKQLYAAIKAKYPGELGWAEMAQAARELGYKDYAEAWERSIAK